jgi:site-specific DNA-methyltransferase (adenine-specific)
VLHVPSESNTVHHTQKPLALFEYLIKTYTNPGELVLDSCMGSGTTAIACLNTGRNFIGFELDPACFQAAQHRLRTRQCSLQKSGDGETPPSEASASASSNC